MPKEYINPPQLFPSLQYGFSQVVTSTRGKTVYLSGQVAWDERQQIVGCGDLRAQVWQALRNVEVAMKASGGALSDVVSLRIYIVEEKRAESAAVREGLQAFFPAERAPASTWVMVDGLADADFLVEIEAVAVTEES